MIAFAIIPTEAESPERSRTGKPKVGAKEEAGASRVEATCSADLSRRSLEPVRDFDFSYLQAVDWRIGFSIRRPFRRMLIFSCFQCFRRVHSLLS